MKKSKLALMIILLSLSEGSPLPFGREGGEEGHVPLSYSSYLLKPVVPANWFPLHILKHRII